MVLQRFLSLFLKNGCPLCDRPTDLVVCLDCGRQLQRCTFHRPQQFWQGDLPLFAWGQYDGSLKRAIATMKYDNHPQLGEWLGAQLGQTWQRQLTKKYPHLTVMPIPMHPDKQKQRGFNQAELIARPFTQINGYRLDLQSLRRTKNTKALFDLTLTQRQQEIANAFQYTPPKTKGKSQPVLLVDDIYTSGTTAKTAAKILRHQGITVLGIAAIATPRNNPQNSPKVTRE